MKNMQNYIKTQIASIHKKTEKKVYTHKKTKNVCHLKQL